MCNMFISNTSTLILLGKINLLSMMLEDFKEIIIPRIVYDEIERKDSFEILSIKKEIKNGRLKILEIDKKHYETIIKEFKLGEGEAAAYALYKKERGRLILTDDGELIKLCKLENASFAVAMSIVINLYQKKKLAREEALEKLKELYGYGRYSEEIYQYFKSEVK